MFSRQQVVLGWELLEFGRKFFGMRLFNLVPELWWEKIKPEQPQKVCLLLTGLLRLTKDCRYFSVLAPTCLLEPRRNFLLSVLPKTCLFARPRKIISDVIVQHCKSIAKIIWVLGSSKLCVHNSFFKIFFFWMLLDFMIINQSSKNYRHCLGFQCPLHLSRSEVLWLSGSIYATFM